MRLFQHPEFEQICIRAAERYRFDEQFVEKDYYVTEILRIVQQELGDRAIFKGGTSLSKGWQLITRFSEDIDIFFDRKRTPAVGKNKTSKILKGLRHSVEEHPGLTWMADQSHTIGGFGREDYFAYSPVFNDLRTVAPTVLLEPGIQSGDFPIETRHITSLAAQFLHEENRADVAEDLEGFDMTLLHYRRTFVEKLFTIHGKVMRLLTEEHPIGRHVRHYSDLHSLAAQHDVEEMLRSQEYDLIRKDYDLLSRKYYAKSYRPPEDLSFAQSPALFPPDDLRQELEANYNAECKMLFGKNPFPAFADVLDRFVQLRALL